MMPSSVWIWVGVFGLAWSLFLGSMVTADIESDRNECRTPLASLFPCLRYVQQQSNSPTKECCGGMQQVVDSNKKCLCILVKDSSNPNLGVKFNVTLALQVPAICNIPVNISECIDLLNLAPNSPDAQIFKQFAASMASSTVSAPGTKGATAGGSSSPSSGWSEQRGCRLEGGFFVLLSGWFFMFLTVFIWN